MQVVFSGEGVSARIPEINKLAGSRCVAVVMSCITQIMRRAVMARRARDPVGK